MSFRDLYLNYTANEMQNADSGTKVSFSGTKMHFYPNIFHM